MIPVCFWKGAVESYWHRSRKLDNVDLSTPKSSNNVKENVTSIDLNNDNDLNLNLDSILNDDKNSGSINLDASSNINSPSPEKPKSFEELQKQKAEFIRLVDRL